MAQLRQDYSDFKARNAEIVVVGPDPVNKWQEYWSKHDLPFIGLPDPEHTVLKKYGQEVRIFKLGRMPAQVLIDQAGKARYVHYGHNMADIPPSEELLNLLDELNQN